MFTEKKEYDTSPWIWPFPYDSQPTEQCWAILLMMQSWWKYEPFVKVVIGDRQEKALQTLAPCLILDLPVHTYCKMVLLYIFAI